MDPHKIPGMRRAGQAAAGTLYAAAALLRPGLVTAELDRFVRADTRARGGRPSQLGYHGFPASLCVSPNEVVCHGIPRETVILRDGDIVNLDVTTQLGGWHGDTSATFFVGRPSPEARHLVDTARRCRDAGVARVRPGVRLSEIGAAIEALARAEGCSVVAEIGGHGIGRAMHEPPFVSHVGRVARDLVLREGMTFTIEPMVNLGSPRVRTLEDGWTVVSADGAWSAQFEHTVLVCADGVEVLTPAP